MPGFMEQVLNRLFKPPGPPPLEWPSAIRLAPHIKQSLTEAVRVYGEAAYFMGAQEGFIVGFVVGLFLAVTLWMKLRTEKK